MKVAVFWEDEAKLAAARWKSFYQSVSTRAGNKLRKVWSFENYAYQPFNPVIFALTTQFHVIPFSIVSFNRFLNAKMLIDAFNQQRP